MQFIVEMRKAVGGLMFNNDTFPDGCIWSFWHDSSLKKNTRIDFPCSVSLRTSIIDYMNYRSRAAVLIFKDVS